MGGPMSNSGPQMKTCHHCGGAVKVSVHRCPHCEGLLAELDLHEWERAGPVSDSLSDDSSGAKFAFERTLAFIVTGCCLLVMGVIAAIGFSRSLSGKAEGERLGATGKPNRVAKGPSSRSSFIRIHEAPSLADGAAAPAEAKELTRREAIHRLSAQVMEQLREEEAITPYRITLKSGRAIDCDIIGESDTHLTIRYRGLTTTIERGAVETMEHRLPEVVERELRELAYARATEMVDRNFHLHGRYWIEPDRGEGGQSPADVTALRTTDEENSGDSRNSRLALQDNAESPDNQTEVEKLISLVSLAREHGVVKADFFGGTLWVKDRSDSRAGRESDSASFVALEAEARRMDLAQVCACLGLPIEVIGTGSADVEMALDGWSASTLAGNAEVTATEVAIPPLGLDTLLLPANQGVLAVNLSAKRGIMVIENLLLAGTTYSISGNGIVRLSDDLEESVAEVSLSVKFDKAPVVTDTRLAGKGAQYLLDSLVASKKDIPVKISGPVVAPEIEVVYDSALGPLVLRLDR
ncbi:MAG: hypothetical protein Kow0099_04060 [Candidatus Abyssubacteria bacterium]